MSVRPLSHWLSRLLSLLAIVALLVSGLPAPLPVQAAHDIAPQPAPAAVLTQAAVSQALRSSPLMFIENAGQFADGARFQVHGGSGTMWLAEDAIWITVVEQTSPPAPPLRGEGSAPLSRDETPPSLLGKGAGGLGLRGGTNDGQVGSALDLGKRAGGAGLRGTNIRLSYVDANPRPRIKPFDLLDTVVSYFRGSDPAQWRPAVPVWGGVRYADLYPGVDLEITSEGGRMAQRLTARPGADLSAVRLRVEGADAVTVDGNALRLTTAAGEYHLPLLAAEQDSKTGHGSFVR